MYKCSHCRQEKTIEEYWPRTPNKKWNRPVQSWCKECVRLHKRLKDTRDKQKIYNYKWRSENKQKVRDYLDKYKEDNLEKVRARDHVRNAVRRYGLRKMPCEECGDQNTQAHHWHGYDKKHFLDVQWLCPLHHAAYEPVKQILEK